MAISAEQRANAEAITRVGVQMGLDAQTIAAAIATALMESGLRNLDYGDRDSLGLFQQRPSQGWGTPAQIRNPEHAARKFFEAYTKSKGSTVLERIANTQRPAAQYRGHYARHFGAAEEILSSITGQPTPRLTGARPSGAHATGGGVTAANSGAAVVAEIDELPPDSTPEQIVAYIEKTYPQAAPFLANPEIRALLVRPDIDDMDELEIEALLRKTEYWRTHSPESRAFDRMLGTEPQAAGALVDRTKNLLSDLFARQGIQVSDEQLGQTAKNAIRSGWVNLQGQVTNEDALADFTVFVLGNQTKGLQQQLPAGEQAYSADQLQAIARQYLVPLTRQQIEQWALDITAGKQSEEAFRSWMTGLSKARFANQPDIVSALEGGFTPSQYFQGHIATIARTLELDESQIDLNDPKWSWAMETVDKNGNRRAPTLGEVAQAARERPEFSNTRVYKEQEAGYAMNLSKFFGASV